jgi:ribonuclease P protein component
MDEREPARWLGLVVPKRHARRAVTRTLLKRQIRQAVSDCAAHLEPGLWVVRQRAPFDPGEFRSAASDALKQAVRAELRALMARAARGERDPERPRAPRRLEDANLPASSRGAARASRSPPAAPERTSMPAPPAPSAAASNAATPAAPAQTPAAGSRE